MNLRSAPTSRIALVLALLLAAGAPGAADNADNTGSGTGAAEPVPARSQRAIFVCHAAGGTVFADRPCGHVAEQREIVLEASSGMAPSTIPRPATATPLRRRKAVAADQRVDMDDRGCSRLRDQLERLDDRMRAGYGARESARLWQQRRELKGQIRQRRC